MDVQPGVSLLVGAFRSGFIWITVVMSNDPMKIGKLGFYARLIYDVSVRHHRVSNGAFLTGDGEYRRIVLEQAN